MAHHTKETMELIKELVSIPSPSGNTAKLLISLKTMSVSGT